MRNTLARHNVRSAGHGTPTLVFGHGFGSDQQAWRFVAPAFEADHRVVLFDHAGFGPGGAAAFSETRHASLAGYARDLLDILAALDARPVIYVGHSIGGLIGALASIEAPARFDRLVMLGASPRFINDPPYVGGFDAAEIEAILDLMERDQMAWARTLAPQAIGGDAPATLVEDFGDSLQRLDPLVARRVGRMVFSIDCRAQLARVGVPALLIHCLRDSIVPREVGHYLHAHLAGSELREIDGAGHCPHLSHPTQTIALIRAYLDATAA